MILFLILSGWLQVAQANDLANSKAWLNLLHYQKTLTGFKSEADGAGFFLSSSGKTDPHKELNASVAALSDATKLYGKLQAPAACIYPARKKFLEKNEVFKELRRNSQKNVEIYKI